jgi:hypothetical protein
MEQMMECLLAKMDSYQEEKKAGQEQIMAILASGSRKDGGQDESQSKRNEGHNGGLAGRDEGLLRSDGGPSRKDGGQSRKNMGHSGTL